MNGEEGGEEGGTEMKGNFAQRKMLESTNRIFGVVAFVALACFDFV